MMKTIINKNENIIDKNNKFSLEKSLHIGKIAVRGLTYSHILYNLFQS